MNRHIERLVEAAPYTTVSTEGRLFTQQNMEEFAKLIIRACALQCQHNDDMDRIEKHFGVEE